MILLSRTPSTTALSAGWNPSRYGTTASRSSTLRNELMADERAAVPPSPDTPRRHPVDDTRVIHNSVGEAHVVDFEALLPGVAARRQVHGQRDRGQHVEPGSVQAP